MALLGALTSWWQRGRTPVVTPREASTAPPRAVAVTITASAVDRNWASALIELAYEGQPTPLSSEATASIRETVEKTLHVLLKHQSDIDRVARELAAAGG